MIEKKRSLFENQAKLKLGPRINLEKENDAYVDEKIEHYWQGFMLAQIPSPSLPEYWEIERVSPSSIRVGLVGDVVVTVSDSGNLEDARPYCLYALCCDLLSDQNNIYFGRKSEEKSDVARTVSKENSISELHSVKATSNLAKTLKAAQEVKSGIREIRESMSLWEIPKGWILLDEAVPSKSLELAMVALKVGSAIRRLQNLELEHNESKNSAWKRNLKALCLDVRDELRESTNEILKSTQALKEALSKEAPGKDRYQIYDQQKYQVNLLDVDNQYNQMYLACRLLGESHESSKKYALEVTELYGDVPAKSNCDLEMLIFDTIDKLVKIDDDGKNIRFF